MSKIIYKGIGYAASILPFIGTDGTNSGVTGLVPAPSALDTNKFLKSDGTWTTPLTAGTGIDITNGVISIDLDNAEGGSY